MDRKILISVDDTEIETNDTQSQASRLKRSLKAKSRPIPRLKENTPTGASTNPKNFDLNKNWNMNLI